MGAFFLMLRDKSVPVSALTNQQADNQPLFLAGQLGMMISHPSDYNVMLDLLKKTTGSDTQKAQNVIDNMRYGLIPTGPDGKRAVVFGGSNIVWIRFQRAVLGLVTPHSSARPAGQRQYSGP